MIVRFSIVIGFGAAVAAGAALAQTHQEADYGKHVYEKANCMGCHKWHGNGGGGYGGSALSLRATKLEREQIIETISCGRPGTGMPYHLQDAYDGAGCYGLSKADVAGEMPPAPLTFLRKSDIEAVADYVLTNIKGKGEPDYADCVAFFGGASHMCHIYQQSAPGDAATKPAQ